MANYHDPQGFSFSAGVYDTDALSASPAPTLSPFQSQLSKLSLSAYGDNGGNVSIATKEARGVVPQLVLSGSKEFDSSAPNPQGRTGRSLSAVVVGVLFNEVLSGASYTDGDVTHTCPLSDVILVSPDHQTQAHGDATVYQQDTVIRTSLTAGHTIATINANRDTTYYYLPRGGCPNGMNGAAGDMPRVFPNASLSATTITAEFAIDDIVDALSGCQFTIQLSDGSTKTVGFSGFGSTNATSQNATVNPLTGSNFMLSANGQTAPDWTVVGDPDIASYTGAGALAAALTSITYAIGLSGSSNAIGAAFVKGSDTFVICLSAYVKNQEAQKIFYASVTPGFTGDDDTFSGFDVTEHDPGISIPGAHPTFKEAMGTGPEIRRLWSAGYI